MDAGTNRTGRRILACDNDISRPRRGQRQLVADSPSGSAGGEACAIASNAGGRGGGEIGDKIADMHHAARIVEGFAVHGQARMAGGAKYLKHIGELCLQRHGDDVGAGNHHVADLHFMQGEDVFQQRAFLRGNIVLDRCIGESILDVIANRRSAEAEHGAQPVEEAWLPAGSCFACHARFVMFSHWRRLLPRSAIPGRGRQSRAC